LDEGFHISTGNRFGQQGGTDHNIFRKGFTRGFGEQHLYWGWGLKIFPQISFWGEKSAPIY